MNSAKRWLVTFLAAFSFLLLRAFPRVIHPDIWAEDGSPFLMQALTDGLSSVFTPTAGYFQFLPRLLAVTFVNTLPFHAIPQAIAISCTLLYAAIVAVWTSPVYEWLFPKQWSRWVLVWLLCIAPGLNEVVGNFCNLNWVFFFGFVFILLRDPKIPLSLFQKSLLLLFLFSTGSVLFAIPILFLRLGEVRKFRKPVFEAVLLGLCLALVVALVLVTPEKVKEAVRPDLKAMYLTFLNSFSISGLFQPWFGDALTVKLLSPGWRRITLGVGLLVFGLLLARGISWRLERGRFLFAVLFLSVAVWPVLGLWVRPGTVTFWLGISDVSFFKMRYSYPLAVAALFFWFSLFEILSAKNKNILTGFFVLVALVSLIPRFEIPAYGSEKRWEKTASILKKSWKTGVPPEVNVSIYPESWGFTYQHR